MGKFDSAEAAAMTYDQAAFAMRGCAAVLNIPVERVKESLQQMKCGIEEEEGCSPIMALKRKHSLSKNKNKNNKKSSLLLNRKKTEESVVALEDLGVKYLEALLSCSSSTSSSQRKKPKSSQMAWSTRRPRRRWRRHRLRHQQ